MNCKDCRMEGLIRNLCNDCRAKREASLVYRITTIADTMADTIHPSVMKESLSRSDRIMIAGFVVLYERMDR